MRCRRRIFVRDPVSLFDAHQSVCRERGYLLHLCHEAQARAIYPIHRMPQPATASALTPPSPWFPRGMASLQAVDEFISAAPEVVPGAVIQFEALATHRALRLLAGDA